MTQDNILSVPPKYNNNIGGLLKTAREKRNLSQKEVSRALCLSVTVIEHLEQEQFERLPGAVFVQGYIRSYAEYLQIPIPILPVERRVDQKPVATREQTKNTPPIVIEFLSFLTNINLNYLIGIVFVVILYFAWHERHTASVTASTLTELSDKVIPFKKIESQKNADALNDTVGILRHPVKNADENMPWRVYDNVKTEAPHD